MVVSRKTVVSDFEQYQHLATLKRLIDADRTGTLRASIGTDYQVKPDVTVGLDSGSGRRFFTPRCRASGRFDRIERRTFDTKPWS